MNFERELGIEARLRKFSWVIPLATILAGTLIAGAMYYLSELFHDGYWWAFIPSGLLMHSFLIVTMHEAAHKSITRSKADRIILNISSAVMLLPMVGELFRKYHLMHHANTNLSADPLWPPVKRELYEDKRWFYILCEGVPLVFTLYLIMKSKSTQKIENTNVKSVPISIFNMVWASAISLIVLWLVQPSVWFVLGSLFVLNIGTTLRHWCEHLGTDTNRESNTYWFPLGMGIGNHETHHHHANLSWLTLSVGLLYRKPQTNPVKALLGVLFNKRFGHYGAK
ncbi:fatty acid desaturase [Salibacteraceae bacterium]|nr:fatty acid desaturase [Salibacteraceae bacterium]